MATTDGPTPEQLRAEYEAGASVSALAAHHHMSHRTVNALLDLAETVRRRNVHEIRQEEYWQRKCSVLILMAADPQRAMHASEIANWLSVGPDSARALLHRLIRDGLVATSEPDQHKCDARRSYWLTDKGLRKAEDAFSPTSVAEIDVSITAVTAQILLVLLQQPIRRWRVGMIAHRVTCSVPTVLNFAVVLGMAGWSTVGRTIDSIQLTDLGVTSAKSTLRDEYGTGPALMLLANAMDPPLDLIEVDDET